MNKTDILLIQPPFAMPDKPGISVAVLVGYLKNRGFKVEVMDLNIEFYHHFLSKENLVLAAVFVNERFSRLGKKHNLNAQEAAEYAYLEILIKSMAAPEKIFYNLFEDKELSYAKKLGWYHLALGLASAAHFPETLYLTGNTGYIRYKSSYSNFSSTDILANLGQETLFSGILTYLLTVRLKKGLPLVLGLSISFPDMVLPAFRCAKIVKSIDPGIHITIGGTFVSAHMRDSVEPCLFEVIDSIILDDGEIPLEILIKEKSGGRPHLDNVPGIIYLSKEKGKVVKVAPAPPLKMENLPPPAYTLFPLDNYLVKQDSMTLLFRLSRGCYWAKCTYCRTKLPFIRHYDQPSADYLCRQLHTLVEQTGIRCFHFTDDSASLEILTNLSEKVIKNKLDIYWGVNLRIDRRLTLERLLLFKKAGCYAASLGLESFCIRVLKLMKKGVNPGILEKVLLNFSLVGIDVSLYMIVGFPTETEEEALESFVKIMDLKEKGHIKHCVYNVFELVPYSVVEAAPAEFGISRVRRIKKRDLAPPVSHFDSTGMTREKAFKLCGYFVARLNETGGER